MTVLSHERYIKSYNTQQISQENGMNMYGEWNEHLWRMERSIIINLQLASVSLSLLNKYGLHLFFKNQWKRAFI